MIIPYSEKSGVENMACDNQLLEYAIKNKLTEPIFRLYGWKPACVSLGRNQNCEFLDSEFLKNKGIDFVRRITGGRALFHDDEITYCFICPIDFLENGEQVISSYKEISKFLVLGMEKLGIKVCYGEKKQTKNAKNYCMTLSTGADLCYEGKKLIGSAQCRKSGYILQHGSILMDYNHDLLAKIFKNNDIDMNITAIKKIDPFLTDNKVIDVLQQSVKNVFNM